MTERVTIDTNLSYNAIPFDENLVIIELKQSRHNRYSSVHSSLKNLGIQPMRISKYCMGMAKNYPSLKQNSFKSKFKKITKITNS
jgi:hypothetical protein